MTLTSISSAVRNRNILAIVFLLKFQRAFIPNCRSCIQQILPGQPALLPGVCFHTRAEVTAHMPLREINACRGFLVPQAAFFIRHNPPQS